MYQPTRRNLIAGAAAIAAAGPCLPVTPRRR